MPLQVIYTRGKQRFADELEQIAEEHHTLGDFNHIIDCKDCEEFLSQHLQTHLKEAREDLASQYDRPDLAGTVSYNTILKASSIKLPVVKRSVPPLYDEEIQEILDWLFVKKKSIRAIKDKFRRSEKTIIAIKRDYLRVNTPLVSEKERNNAPI